MAHLKFDQFVEGGNVRIGDTVVGLRASNPNKNYQFDFPGSGIEDGNGNLIFGYDSIGASAVNYLNMVNATALNPALLQAQGAGADVGIEIRPKGIGGVLIDGLNWPLSDGVAGSFMTTDGIGNLSFTTGVTTGIRGTANQVLVNGTTGSYQSGDVTLTTPQNIGTTSSPTFANLTLSTGFIYDSNGNEVVQFAPTPSAANYLNIYNNSSGLAPTLEADGSDLNVGMDFATKGTGVFGLYSEAASDQLSIKTGSGFQHVTNFSFPTTANTRTATIQDSDGTFAWLSDIASNGTVNSGTINQLGWYAATGNDISGLATANNGVLVTDGSGVPSISSILPAGLTIPGYTMSGFTSINLRVFTSGTVAYTPTANTKYCLWFVTGGGGSGGSSAGPPAAPQIACGGGGAGGSTSWIAGAVATFAGQNITVGAGGAAPAAGNNNGNQGGTSSIGALVSVPGGNGGAGSAASASSNAWALGGASSGAGSGGTVNSLGGCGFNSNINGVDGTGYSGQGGASFWGSGAASRQPAGNGFTGTAFGSGGSGAASTNAAGARAGGQGAPGVIVLLEFI